MAKVPLIFKLNGVEQAEFVDSAAILADFLRDKLLASDLVSGVESRIIMRSVKSTTAVPIRLVMNRGDEK